MQLTLKKLPQFFIPADAHDSAAFGGLKKGFYTCKVTRQRNSKFHRKYMALLNHAFGHWDTPDGNFKDFDVFRKNIAVLAGFYDQAYDLQGNLQLVAKSISFANMDGVEFEALYSKTIDVILKHVLHNYTKDDLEQVVLDILRFD